MIDILTPTPDFHNAVMIASGSYRPTKWDEQDVFSLDMNKKLTKASIEFSLTGEIEGVALIEYLMYYNFFDPNDQHGSDARYVGYMKFEGSILGKRGTFLMEDEGTFAAGAARSALTILKDSGTKDLTGITGNGSYIADASGARMELRFELA